MFKFLQRAAFVGQTDGTEQPVAPHDPVAGGPVASVHDLAEARAALSAQSEPSAATGAGSNDTVPSAAETGHAVLGLDVARAALKPLSSARPRSAFFIVSPGSADHDAALDTLIREASVALPVTDAVVLVGTFGPGGSGSAGVRDVRLPRDQAERLSRAVSDAIEMLSATLPAAFASDSVQVAMLALDEELRSSHDQALDALKRKANAQNIGLLRTPQGYAVAPLHDGRIVASDVFKALPDSLKAEVENKLQTFETELGAVLANRAVLQQDHSARRRDLTAEIAGLAVRAALKTLFETFKSYPAVRAYLDELSADLIANAALFLAAARAAGGQPRAPADLGRDPRLARYGVAVLPCAGPQSVVRPDGLERADVCGEVRNVTDGVGVVPSAVRAGALTTAGRGFLVIEARDLLAQYSAWPILKQALKTGVAIPADRTSATGRAHGVTVPVEASLVVVGEQDDYRTLCHMDRDVARLVRLIPAFEAMLPLTPALERAFHARVATLIQDDALLPLDPTALTALRHERTQTVSGVARLATDMDAVRECLQAATHNARAHGRASVVATDILAALKQRDDRASGSERGAR